MEYQTVDNSKQHEEELEKISQKPLLRKSQITKEIESHKGLKNLSQYHHKFFLTPLNQFLRPLKSFQSSSKRNKGVENYLKNYQEWFAK